MTEQELAITKSPLAFIEMRNVMTLQVEEQVGPALRRCADVSERTVCRVRFRISVDEDVIHTLGVQVRSCRAAEQDRDRVYACFGRMLRSLDDVALPFDAAELREYQGDVDIDFDWDRTAPTPDGSAANDR